MEPWGDSILVAVITAAVGAGAVLARFGGALIPKRSEADRDAREDRANRPSYSKQMLDELIEMRKVMHTNTKVMNDIRGELGSLRMEVAKIEGMMSGRMNG